MTLETKRIVIAVLGGLFLLSLVFVQWMEVARKQEEAGVRKTSISVPANSKDCVKCHAQANPGIIDTIAEETFTYMAAITELNPVAATVADAKAILAASMKV